MSFKPNELADRVTGMSEATRQPVVSGSQVLAAGLASAAAAVVTSRFGVAGTLLGAALTAMIITGGSAILKSYLESVTGTVRKVPRKMRAKANRAQAGRADAPATIPGRPDLRENFMGRMRAAMGWFSHLPTLRRRSIMVKGLIAALVAFVIGMGAITAVEAGILKGSLSCKLWGDCTAATGTTGTSATGTSAGTGGGTSTIGNLLGGSAGTSQEPAPAPDQQAPSYQQDPAQQQDSGTPVVEPDPAAEEPAAPEAPVEEPAVEPETPATPGAAPQTPASSGAEEAAPVE